MQNLWPHIVKLNVLLVKDPIAYLPEITLLSSHKWSGMKAWFIYPIGDQSAEVPIPISNFLRGILFSNRNTKFEPKHLLDICDVHTILIVYVPSDH
jgi:hypothetical protein